MQEIWKEIPASRGYTVSTLGRVKNPEGDLMKITFNGSKELAVCQIVMADGKGTTKSVASVMVDTFLEDTRLPSGKMKQVYHIDGNKRNNVLENLTMDRRNRVLTGTYSKVNNTLNSDYEDEFYKLMRNRFISKSDLQVRFNVSLECIDRTWLRLEKERGKVGERFVKKANYNRYERQV